MEFTIQDEPKSRKSISVVVPFSEFETVFAQEADSYAKSASIKGFRPGKAPRDVVMQQNKRTIQRMALDKVVGASIYNAVSESGLNPISEPVVTKLDFSDENIDKKENIHYTVEFDVYPTIQVSGYDGHTFEQDEIELKDGEIVEVIREFAEKNTPPSPVDEKIEKDDVVTIDFVGKVDGVPFDGGKANGYDITIGSGVFIEGFEEQLIGAKKGDVVQVNVKFPDNYHAENLKGKDSVFDVTVQNVRRKKSPELNDEFAKTLDPKVSTFEELRKKVEEDFIEQAETTSDEKLFSDMLDKILEKNVFEVPEALIREQAERLSSQVLSQYHYQGIDPKDLGLTKEQLVKNYHDSAERQVKSAIIMYSLGERENISVEEADIEKELDKIAEIEEKDTREIRQMLEKNKQFENFKNKIYANKVLEMLKTKNTVNKHKLSRQEFTKKHASTGGIVD